MNWESAQAQELGGRREQQDRVAILDARDGTERLLVVADGAGWHEGGARAAQAVIDAATERWHTYLADGGGPDALVADICRDAHERIVALGGTGRYAPRSTCVVLHTDDGAAHWASVGDSRLYHFRRGRMVARSKDHSVVQMLVDMGKIDESDMATHPDQNRLTQSLGGDKAPEPHFGRAAVEPGDAFVLCTDGVWETVSTEAMAKGLAEPSLGSAMKAIVHQAQRRGGAGADNATVAAARSRASGRGLPRWALPAIVLIALGASAGAVLWLGDLLLANGSEQNSGAADPTHQTSIPDTPSLGAEPEDEAAPEKAEPAQRPDTPEGGSPVPLSPDGPEG